MTGITLTVDDAALRRALDRLAHKVDDLSPALRDIGEYLVRTTDLRFRAEVAPDGTPWAQNSDTTLLRYLNKGGKGFTKKGRLSARGAKRLGMKKILRADGFLQDTIRYQLADGGRAVEIGTDRVYGAMQQFGGTKAQHPQLWGTIPARPFLGLSAADRAGILAILKRHIARGL